MKYDFTDFTKTLKNSIKTWEYFVNWEKVFKNKREAEIALNKMNYLLGKENLKEEFIALVKAEPDVIKTLPMLLAVRENVLEVYDRAEKTSKFFDFTAGTQKQTLEEYYEFMEHSGLVRIFKKDGVKNLVDYVIGVETGLESNWRKNRGGSLMEHITEEYIKQYCTKNGFSYLSQASPKKIYEEWGVSVVLDKAKRNFDFAVYNPNTKHVKLFEVNFFNGGGSKLKAVCGEFKGLFDELRQQEIELVWITDGMGWRSVAGSLEEVFRHNDHVFNLHMMEQGALQTLVW